MTESQAPAATTVTAVAKLKNNEDKQSMHYSQLVSIEAPYVTEGNRPASEGKQAMMTVYACGKVAEAIGAHELITEDEVKRSRKNLLNQLATLLRVLLIGEATFGTDTTMEISSDYWAKVWEPELDVSYGGPALALAKISEAYYTTGLGGTAIADFCRLCCWLNVSRREVLTAYLNFNQDRESHVDRTPCCSKFERQSDD